MLLLSIIAATSYLLGSIPFGYLLVLIFRREDVRLSGSGNIGATNVSRKSPALGVLTLLLDALKGAAAVALARFLLGRIFLPVPFAIFSMAAFCAVLGHMFPVWLKFRGGKGVATALGSFALIAPRAVLLAALIFIAVVAISRYVSLASIVSVASFPFFVYGSHTGGTFSLALGFMAVTSFLIVARHHQNIRRLLAGEESRLGAKRT
jgi:acyl phosphate:glycerol-3-phosphate acyltransferase